MKRIIISPILLCFFLRIWPVAAQEPANQLRLENLTLDEAVSWSVSHSPEITIQRLKQQKEEQELSRLQRSRIPTVYLSGDIRRNLIIPATPIPATLMDPGADPDEMRYMQFNTNWNSGAGVNLSYDIFNPATFRQVSEQKLQNRISSYDTRISEADIRAEIAQAYAGCVIAQEQVESMISDTLFYHQSMEEAIVLYEKGIISQTDKNNAVIDCNTSLLRFQNAERVLRASKTNLLYLLGTEVSEKNLETMHFSENIPVLYDRINSQVKKNDIGESPGDGPGGLGLARQAEVIALSDSRIKSAMLKYAPSFSMNGFYGSNYYDNYLHPGDGNLWHGNSFVSLSLKIPVTQAFTTTREVALLKRQNLIEKQNLFQMQNRKSKDWLDARNQLQSSEKEYEITRKNYELSRENLDATRARLDKAHIAEKDYLAEKAGCRNAYQLFLQAAYHVFVDTITLKKLETK